MTQLMDEKFFRKDLPFRHYDFHLVVDQVWDDFQEALAKNTLRQNQSPDSSTLHLVIGNFSRLKRSEVNFLLFSLIFTKNIEIQKYLYFVLVEQRKGFEILQLGVLNDVRREIERTRESVKKRFSCKWRELFLYPFFPPRLIKGTLKDPCLGKLIEKRFRVYLRQSRKPKKQQRIRGYRDHGTLSEPSRWLPKESPRCYLDHLRVFINESFLDNLLKKEIPTEVSLTIFKADMERLRKLELQVEGASPLTPG